MQKKIKNKIINVTPFNQIQPHTFLVKGKAYRQQFLAGAGGFHYEINEFSPVSLDWVLQQDWTELKIRPLP
jgi:hypothetical protein